MLAQQKYHCRRNTVSFKVPKVLGVSMENTSWTHICMGYLLPITIVSSALSVFQMNQRIWAQSVRGSAVRSLWVQLSLAVCGTDLKYIVEPRSSHATRSQQPRHHYELVTSLSLSPTHIRITSARFSRFITCHAQDAGQEVRREFRNGSVVNRNTIGSPRRRG